MYFENKEYPYPNSIKVGQFNEASSNRNLIQKARLMKLFLFIICLLINLSILYGQKPKLENLWEVWNNESVHDTIRLQALKDFIIKKKYYSTNLDSSIILSDEIVNFAHSKNNLIWKAEGFRLKGLSYYYHGQNENAIIEYKQTYELKKELNHKKGFGGILHNIAVSYRLIGDLPKALEYNFEALAARKEMNLERGVSKSLQGIATVYYDQKKYEEALEYANESFDLSKKINYDVGAANAAVSIANSYSGLEKYPEAISFYSDAMTFYKQLGRLRSQATCFDNIGNAHLKEKKYKLALEFQKKAFEIRKQQSDKNGLALSYNNLGSTYARMKKYQSSLNNCEEALKLATETENLSLIFNSSKCLYEAYEAIGDIPNAYKYYQDYIIVKDSVEGVEKTKSIEEVESKYELKEKEAVIAQRELDIAKEQNKQSNTIIISLLALGLISLIFAVLRSRLLMRRREAELTAEKEHIEADKLRELDRLKSTFFTNISHEIRTPLTLIMSPLEQMLNGTLKGDALKYKQIMYRNGQRLQSLINQLLDLSKIESGHLQLNLQEADLSQFLISIVQSFTSLAERKQIDFRVNGLADHVMAYFDKDVIEKILMNLISNAFKFTQEEGNIEIDINYESNLLNFEIKDSGIGIPENQVNSIFDRFYSSESVSDLQMSSGIGLALTKELVELCEGKIEVESEEQKGSVFTVSIPIIAVKSDTILEVPIVKQLINLDNQDEIFNPEKSIPNGQKLPHVLIVEDNEDVRIYLNDQLNDFYKISEANNGVEGLAMAKKRLPDLIVSDVMMPEMDGNEMCKELKTDSLTSHIPIILLTAKGEQKDRIEGLETGADAYLTKPFDQAELQIRIHNLIEQRQQLRNKFSSDFKFSPSEVTITSLDANFLNSVKSIIETNMEDETFSVEELSKEVGMSRSNLFRKLKALTDQSPNQVIREMRLIRAKYLIQKGAGNSAEVAYLVGFNSPTYFSKCFSDYFGVSPMNL